jgi:hypothetical protein
MSRGPSLFLSFVMLTAPGLGQVSPGYQTHTHTLAPAGQFVGGFDVLPRGGNAVIFDGSAVVEVDRAGAVQRTLYTPPTPVFGAFVHVHPDGTRLYFGESSLGDVVEIDLATLRARTVLSTGAFPFDLAFDPAGRAFLAWSPGFGLGSVISHVDLATGLLDDVFQTIEASGPLVFDAAGDLLFVLPDTSNFPPPPDASPLLRLTAAQLRGALGRGALTESDATLVALLDGAYGMALDESGDLFVTDSNYGTLVEVAPATGAEQLVYQAGAFLSLSYLRFVPGQHAGRPGAFAPYQPAGSGRLAMLETDFFSFNDLRAVTPLRPELATRPASPVPVGRYTLELTHGVPSGLALVVLGAGVIDPEIALGRSVPLYFGLDLRGRVGLFPLLADAAGGFSLSLFNPGIPASFALQVFVGGRHAGLLGSSNPLAIELLRR